MAPPLSPMLDCGAMNDQIDIASATGVDLQLRVAGAGARSYAFVIDWHIRLLLALAWFAGVNLVMFGSLAWLDSEDPAFGSFSAWVFLPSVVIYLGYHPVLEILMRGRTPGKRIAGVRILTLEGQTPGFFSLLIRNLMRLLDSLPGAYAVGLVSCVLTANSVRIGDLAAGTLLAYESDDRGGNTSNPSFNPAAVTRYGLDKVELASELLERWDRLDEEKRGELAVKILTMLKPDTEWRANPEVLREQLKILMDEPA